MEARSPGDALRVDALASFSHEVRTPLTAIRMVLDLGASDRSGGKMLDAELVGLLESSLAEMTQLLDQLQDFSRAERGRLQLVPTPSMLSEILADAGRTAGEALQLAVLAPRDIVGHWDASRLAQALADLAVGVDRMGAADGRVRGNTALTAETLVIVLESGTADGSEISRGAPLPVFAYFSAGALIMAMGGTIATDQQSGYCRLEITLPIGP